MPLVFEDIDLPGGANPGLDHVEITLFGAGQPVRGRQVSTGKTIGGTARVPVDATGSWSIDLVSNFDIAPSGTTYQIKSIIGCDELISFVSVPITGGPYIASTIEDDSMNSVAQSLLAQHASDTSLHAGHELGTATIGFPGFSTSSTTMVDVTGMSITFTVPNRPYRVEFSIPMLVDDTASSTTVQLTDAVNDELFNDIFNTTTTNQGRRMNGWCRVPNAFHNPTPGTTVTYKLQMLVSAGTVVAAIVPDLFGARNIPIIQAIAQ